MRSAKPRIIVMNHPELINIVLKKCVGKLIRNVHTMPEHLVRASLRLDPKWVRPGPPLGVKGDPGSTLRKQISRFPLSQNLRRSTREGLRCTLHYTVVVMVSWMFTWPVTPSIINDLSVVRRWLVSRSRRDPFRRKIFEVTLLDNSPESRVFTTLNDMLVNEDNSEFSFLPITQDVLSKLKFTKALPLFLKMKLWVRLIWLSIILTYNQELALFMSLCIVFLTRKEL